MISCLQISRDLPVVGAHDGKAGTPRYIQRPDGPQRSSHPLGSKRLASDNEYPSRGLPRGIDGRRISRCPEPFKVLDHIVRQRRPARQRDTEPVLGADVAQLVEQLTRNEQVVRSNRIVGSILVLRIRAVAASISMAAIWCCGARPDAVGLGVR